jgi:hypothetical protein
MTEGGEVITDGEKVTAVDPGQATARLVVAVGAAPANAIPG